MRTAAILPVKRFSNAKQRLGRSVADPLHADLVRAMVGDVLGALRDCPSIECTIVVTNEQTVAAAVSREGTITLPDTAEDGQSAAVALGIARAHSEGLERALCIPGDCPAMDPDELVSLLEEPPGGEPAVVIVPDRHGTGTNGLLLTLPAAISPSFGTGSRARHEQLARAAGAACRVEQPPSLLLDIDTGEDLAALRERLAGERVRAPRTRAVLGLPLSNPSRAA
jgi:2-phospho-L-lactate guanylyltransferase